MLDNMTAAGSESNLQLKENGQEKLATSRLSTERPSILLEANLSMTTRFFNMDSMEETIRPILSSLLTTFQKT